MGQARAPDEHEIVGGKGQQECLLSQPAVERIVREVVDHRRARHVPQELDVARTHKPPADDQHDVRRPTATGGAPGEGARHQCVDSDTAGARHQSAVAGQKAGGDEANVVARSGEAASQRDAELALAHRAQQRDVHAEMASSMAMPVKSTSILSSPTGVVRLLDELHPSREHHLAAQILGRIPAPAGTQSNSERGVGTQSGEGCRQGVRRFWSHNDPGPRTAYLGRRLTVLRDRGDDRTAGREIGRELAGQRHVHDRGPLVDDQDIGGLEHRLVRAWSLKAQKRHTRSDTLSAARRSSRTRSLPPPAIAIRMHRKRRLPRFTYLLATSEEDGRVLRDISPDSNVLIYRNSIPLSDVPSVPKQHMVVFSGNLEYHPNISAVRYFREEIWPRLRRRWPSLIWRLVGKNPHAVARIVAGDSRIELSGAVPDAVTELARARVAIVPLRAGSGTRLKIIEAWAAGVPVVSTSLGAEGLPARAGEHLLLADDPRSFEEAVSSLLANEPLAGRIGRSGRYLFECEFTWEAAWKGLHLLDPCYHGGSDAFRN